MKSLKNLKNKLNYKIFLKNKGIIDIYFNKKNTKHTLYAFPLSDYNSHRLWKIKFQSQLLNSTINTLLKKFETKYTNKK